MYYYEEKRKKDEIYIPKQNQKVQYQEQQKFYQSNQQPQQVQRNTQQREQRKMEQKKIERKNEKQIQKLKKEQFNLFFQTISDKDQNKVIQELYNQNNLKDLFFNLRICANSYDSYTSLIKNLRQAYKQDFNVILSGSNFNTIIFERCTLLQLYQNSIEDLDQKLIDLYHLFFTMKDLDYQALKESSIASKYITQSFKVKQVQYVINLINFQIKYTPPTNFQNALEFFPNPGMHSQLFGKLEILSKENKNVDRYIDYHFNLLREDYILEFKEAIISLNELGFENIDKSKTSQIKLYHDIELLQVNMNNFEIMWKIQVKQFNFDGKGMKKINWEKSNILMPGSLICLTNIECYPLIFGVITKRDKYQSEYEYGLIQLEFSFIDPNTSIMQFLNLFSQKTILIQFDGLVEPIHYYLQALKSKTSLPFQNIIVENQNDVKYPEYLNNKQKFEIDLSKNDQYRGYIFNILNPIWPELNSTLDGSQLNAIKIMLQKQVALIQGPPGTGKTYCGALAVRILYQNLLNNNFPILIVCYTNHALDQFLEHIIKFVPLEDVARLGGASKHPELQKCQIRCRQKIDFEFQIFNKLKQKISKVIERMLKYDYIIRPKDIKKYWPELYNIIIKKFIEDNNLNYEFFINQQEQDQLVNFWIECDNSEDDTLENSYQDEMSKYFKMDQFYQESEQFKHLIKSDCLQQQQFQSEDEDLNIYLDSDDEAHSYNNYYKEANFDLIAVDNAIKQFNEKQQNFQLLHYDFQSIQKIINYVIHQKGNPWFLNPNDIEQILIYLESLRYQNDSVKFSRLYQQFIDLSNNLKELYDENEIKILNSMKIVGVTVTGVAKQAKKLEKLNTKIMIIEEAAEVLESHVASILTKNLQHLILIGDHQQLKPKLKNYSLQMKLKNADVSLFERLFFNDIPSAILTSQRRMKSKFADFIRLIYSNSYQDHPDINKQNNIEIQGLEKDLVFFNHKWPEASNEKSKENKLEAQMIFEMVQYLCKCGYQQTQISVLTLYLRQAQVLKSQFFKSGYNNIIVQTVDNYQGEENDIVIISLVRNNQNNKLGYIQIENRINVALSRARLGLYVFGNFDFIYKASINGSLWQKIIQLAKIKNYLNDYINTKCIPHGNLQKIKYPEDWKKIKPFFCNKKCLKMYSNCNHLCNLDCHISDFHSEESCPFQCDRVMQCGHKCKLLCKDKCQCKEIIDLQLSCEHQIKTICGTNPQTQKCLKEVQIQYPKCLHIKKFICYQRDKYIYCQQKCERILNCGHTCNKICYVDCGNCMQECNKVRPCGHNTICKNFCYEDCSPCDFPVQTELDCGHTIEFPCISQKKDQQNHKCQQNCRKKRECGHYLQICENKCHEQCSPCYFPIEKQLKCSHYVIVNCFEANNKEQEIRCIEACQKPRQCGHDQTCLNKCYQECSPCQVMISKILNCGHSIQIECYKQNQEYQCQQICTRKRDCNHDQQCTNLCYEQCSPCIQIINHTLPCNHNHQFECHSFNISLQQFICHEPCLLQRSCGHTSVCLSKCYENKCSPCLQIVNKKLDCGHIIKIKCCEFQQTQICQEPCNKIRECGHINLCKKLCIEPCQPCEYDVLKTLPCNHQSLVKCYQQSQPIICKENCIKVRDCGHYYPCTNLCFETCTPCKSVILQKLQCKHEIDIECSQLSLVQLNYKCSQQCIKTRICGHNYPCYNICYTNNECTPCQANIQKDLVCGHQFQIKCFQRMQKFNILCDKPCKKQRPCKHNISCQNKCYEPCSPCTKLCEIVLNCGHQGVIKCFQKDDQSVLNKIQCFLPCTKKSNCGHNSNCKKQCYQKCDPCSTQVQKLLNCGHFYKAFCQQDPNTIKCQEPCKIKLNCGHPCQQICGTPCLRCEQIIIKLFPNCSHQLEIKCYENNQIFQCQQQISVIKSCKNHFAQIKCCEQDQFILECQECKNKNCKIF
ncbi:unnamed protein product [Paramecium primaurelia]|uniref:P-loop containing nucleoside triphosphate hydrolase n=1 Tax=Paramecium primaurelia TaxID=5886 RepID=A0A8S1KW40_PARPR|nr:unnamed protein product [Paramecium primaurelia]